MPPTEHRSPRWPMPRARRASAPRAVFAAFASAPRCSTSTAACTPAATSRTRPIRKACAPRPWRSAQLVLAGGTRVRRRWWSAWRRRRVTPCGGCRQKLREFADADTPVLGRPTASQVRALHAGRTAAGQLRPGRICARHDAARPSTTPSRTAPRACAPAAARPRIAVLLGSGWDGCAARSSDAARHPLCRAAGVSGAGRRRPCRHAACSAASAAHEWRCCAAASTPTKTATRQAMKGADRARWPRAACRCWCRPTRPAASTRRCRPGALMLIADHLNIVQRSPLHRRDRLGALRRPARRLRPGAAPAGARGRAAPRRHAARRRLRLGAGPAVRDAGRDPHAAAAGRAGGRHEHRARDHPGAPLRACSVLALSMITNMAAGLLDEQLSHAHTLASAQAAGARAVPLLRAIVEALEI